jgi:hypothetical protein
MQLGLNPLISNNPLHLISGNSHHCSADFIWFPVFKDVIRRPSNVTRVSSDLHGKGLPLTEVDPLPRGPPFRSIVDG